MVVRHGLRRAVEQTLEQADSNSDFFASEPTIVNSYAVLVVVRLDRARYRMHYRLERDTVRKGHISYSVGCSLIETTVRAFLATLADVLQRPEPGRDVLR